QKGVRLEYDVIGFFGARGFDTTRSAGSKGAKDVIAARVGTLLYIQCKRSKRPIPVEEWNALIDASEGAGAVPLLAPRRPGKPSELFRLLPRRKPRSRLRPTDMEPFAP